MPASIETLYCRGDKGFGGEAMYAACEERMIGYDDQNETKQPAV
ncbi:hypothetical protein [Paenibacillus sp. OK003]|nr:hypothetical protein [Paenibacillus sp. OK003]